MIGGNGRDHVWGPPPAGSGKQSVCRNCGTKRSAAVEDRACDGPRMDVHIPTRADYDPFDP